jgi:hypothetical protein
MKKSIFFVGLAALALAGCSQNDSVTGSDSASNAVGFSTFVQKATKGTPVAGVTFPVDGDFLVLGYSTGTTSLSDAVTAATAAPNFMRQTVTQTASGVYTYSPLRYWPSTTGSMISFFAVSPASVSTSVVPTAISATPGALPVVSYAVPTDPVKQVDMMLASAIDKKQSDGTAAFSFTHALTKIGFTAKLAADYGAAGTYIRINSISLTNVAGTGVFSAAVGGTWAQTTPTDFSSTFTLDYLKNLVDNGSVSTTTAKPMVLDNSYLMLVPADYSASATAALAVTYTITNADGAITTVTSSTLLSSLTEVGAKTWTSGSAITYNLKITLNAVSFSASTTDWTLPTSTADLNN